MVGFISSFFKRDPTVKEVLAGLRKIVLATERMAHEYEIESKIRRNEAKQIAMKYGIKDQRVRVLLASAKRYEKMASRAYLLAKRIDDAYTDLKIQLAYTKDINEVRDLIKSSIAEALSGILDKNIINSLIETTDLLKVINTMDKEIEKTFTAAESSISVSDEEISNEMKKLELELELDKKRESGASEEEIRELEEELRRLQSS